MQLPTKDAFRKWRGSGFVFYGTNLHPNPRLYKYMWQIWMPDATLEGPEFLEHGPRYSTARFFETEKRLIEAGVSGFIYNRKLPRSGMGKPFDLTHPRWANRIWAPAWEDDPDPVWNGHK